jgi:hypothetical protein
LDTPNRKRSSDIRKELLRVQRDAKAAAKVLERLRVSLCDLTPLYRELLHEPLHAVEKIAIGLVATQAPWFHALRGVGTVAGSYAGAIKNADKGGAPKMIAFHALIWGLKQAFEHATRRAAKVTWSEHQQRYGGRFLTLVEAVLPLALALSEDAGRPLRYPPSPEARGKYIFAMTRAGTRSRRTPRN